jgi:hypothetical protein
MLGYLLSLTFENVQYAEGVPDTVTGIQIALLKDFYVVNME